MTTLTPATAHLGQSVRVRIRRSWYPATITQLGTDYAGTPSAALDVDGVRRCEPLCKLRPALFPEK